MYSATAHRVTLSLIPYGFKKKTVAGLSALDPPTAASWGPFPLRRFATSGLYHSSPRKKIAFNMRRATAAG